MNEHYYQDKIKRGLEKVGAEVSKYHATIYGVKGHTDLFASIPVSGIAWPIAVYIEVKAPEGVLSPAQEIFIANKIKKGHLACVAVYLEDVWEYLRGKGLKV